MTHRFVNASSAFAVALLALAGCSHEPKPGPETAAVPAPPFFAALTGARDEPTGSIATGDEKAASADEKASPPGALDVNQRLAALELDMAAMKIEMSRLNELDSRVTALEGGSPHSAAKLEPAVADVPAPKLKVPADAGVAPLPVPAAQKVAAKSGTKSALLPEDIDVPASVKALEPTATTAAPAPASEPTTVAAVSAPAAPTPSKGGDYAVQLAAYSSPQSAAKGWESLSTAAGALLSDLQPKREEAQIAGLGTLYRLKAGPFASSAEAEQRCASLKAEGHSCLVTRFDGVWP